MANSIIIIPIVFRGEYGTVLPSSAFPQPDFLDGGADKRSKKLGGDAITHVTKSQGTFRRNFPDEGDRTEKTVFVGSGKGSSPPLLYPTGFF